MATDGMNPSGKPEFKGMMLTLLVANDAEAKLLFEALSADGKIYIPLAKTFWSSLSGMTADRFGMGWMVKVAA